MTRDVVTVTPDTSVRDLARTLLEHRISGVPVVDGEGHVLGMVSEADLVERVSGPHLPPHIELLGGVIYLENPLHLEEKLRKAMAVTAGAIMSTHPVTVGPTTPLRGRGGPDGEAQDQPIPRRGGQAPGGHHHPATTSSRPWSETELQLGVVRGGASRVRGAREWSTRP